MTKDRAKQLVFARSSGRGGAIRDSRGGTPQLSSAVLLALLGHVSACKSAKSDNKPAPAASISKTATELEATRVALTPEAATRLGIEVGKVEERTVRRTRTVGGDVLPGGGQPLLITAPIAGIVGVFGKTGFPEIGQRVATKDPLFTLMPAASGDRDVRSQTRKDVEVATAKLKAAQARFDRQEKLYAAGLASLQTVEDVRAELDVAKAEAKEANTQGRTAEGNPLASDGALEFRAPSAGKINRVHVAPGMSVASGAALLDIVGTQGLLVRARLYVGDYRRASWALPAAIRPLIARPGQSQVLALAVQGPPTAEPAAAAMDAYFALPDSASFTPGERVAVTLAMEGEEQRAVVPHSAIVYASTGVAWVYAVVGDKVYERRTVEVLDVRDGTATLAKGPPTGTEIVTTGAAELLGTEFGTGK